jgi:outer membrane protein assembly factor BamA
VTYKTENNLPLFIRDYKNYLRREHEAKAGIIYRANLYEQTTLELVYRSAFVEDTVIKLNPDFFGRSKTNLGFMSLQYRYTYDNRDNKVYPLNGWAFDLWATKDGFDFSPTSVANLLSVTASLRKHTQLADRFFISDLIRGRAMNPDYVSFNFNRALGWNDFIRGYEYFVLDGQRYFLTSNSLRYQIVKPRILQSKLLKRFKQFNTIPFYAFVNVFFDAGFVEENYYSKTNTLNNSWQYGYGVGLDMVSYYDVVVRLEYSFNRQLQRGFFIHLTSGF